MIRLGINLDHVSTVRQARLERYPDPVQAALLAELGGADNITCHLREDRRHIQDRDLELLKSTIKIPLNFEMAATSEMVGIACKIKPEAITLVPEKRQELTTEGGLNTDSKESAKLQDMIAELKEGTGALISLFVDPTPQAMIDSERFGADAVEIHTGDFCLEMEKCRTSRQQFELLRPLNEASKKAHDLGLQVHFGHGLHYNNAYWLQHIEYAEEANIGHAVIARAIYVGLKQAVIDMKDLLNNRVHKPLGSL